MLVFATSDKGGTGRSVTSCNDGTPGLSGANVNTPTTVASTGSGLLRPG